MEMLGWITGAEGQHARAAHLLGAAHTNWRSTGMSPSGPRYLAPSHDHCEHVARHALGDEQFTTAFQHGTRLTPDQAVDCALDRAHGTATARPGPHPSAPAGLRTTSAGRKNP
jgi:hypothetical protein